MICNVCELKHPLSKHIKKKQLWMKLGTLFLLNNTRHNLKHCTRKLAEVLFWYVRVLVENIREFADVKVNKFSVSFSLCMSTQLSG